MMVRKRALSLLALSLLACGDPIAPGDFSGQARFELDTILCGDAEPEQVVRPTFGVLWKWYDQQREAFEFGQISSVEARTFPAHFKLPIYDLPPTELSNRYASGQGGLSADVGCPVVFDDLDADGHYSSGDLLLAISWDQLLVYVRDEPGAPEGLPLHFQGATTNMTEGYHIARASCDEGQMNQLRFEEPGAVMDISFLEVPGEVQAPEGACIRFF